MSNYRNRKVIYGIFVIFVLTFSILPTFGQVSGPSNPNVNQTTSHQLQQQNQTPVLSVTTDKSSYKQGDNIVITGNISSVDSTTSITIRVFSSSSNLISVSSLLPNSDGSFAKTFLANGPLWKDAGTYSILVQYGKIAQKTVTFYYQGGDGEDIVHPAISTSSVTNQASTSNTINQSVTVSTPAANVSKIPTWVKGIFKYYGEEQLSDDDIIKAIQFLIQQGIIKV